MENQILQKQLLAAQRNEISESHTYRWLSRRLRDGENRRILERITNDEYNHYTAFQRITQKDQGFLLSDDFADLRPVFRAQTDGTRGNGYQQLYGELKEKLPELADVSLNEQKQETKLIGMAEKERLKYTGSIVLGLNADPQLSAVNKSP